MPGPVFWICVFLVVYVYAGYPSLAAALAAFKKKPDFSGTHVPSITLLIAAYNEEAVIEEKLRNGLHLDYPADKLHILVAADGSDDRTVEIVKEFASRGVELSFQ
ncbi:glycosyltransferase, partial [Planctomycetota bacterium]